MKSNKKHIRIDYAPLNLAVSVQCLTPSYPALQVLDSTGSSPQYTPDREVNETVLWPQVFASAADGSWHNQYANLLLVDMKWFVNGVDITTHPDWTGNNGVGDPKFKIDETRSNNRGSIHIKRNVAPTEQYSLHFEGVIADTRLGTRIPIVTEEVILSTEDKTEDAFSLSIGDDQVIQYNPFKDKLFLYDYKVAHGQITASSAAELAATDENAYLRRIPVTLFQGAKAATSGFTIELYRVNSATSFTKLTVDTENEVEEIANDHITLDLRTVTKGDYLVRAVLTDSARPNPQMQFSVNRVYTEFKIVPSNGTSILPSDVQRFDKAMVQADGNIVECPDSILKINWFTDSANTKGLAHNEGETTLFTIAKTGIGHTYEDDWLDVYCEAEIKSALDIATDESGNTLTDENGDTLIFN